MNRYVGELSTDVYGINADESKIGHISWTEAQAVATDADGLVDGEATSTTATTTITTFLNTMPCCRNLVFTPSGTMKADSTITITGTNIANNKITETITLTAVSTAVYSVNCFKTVEKIEITAQTTAITFDIGWAGKLGVPYVLTSEVRLLATYLNNVLEGTAPTVSRDINVISKNGITLNSVLNGKVVDAYFMI